MKTRQDILDHLFNRIETHSEEIKQRLKDKENADILIAVNHELVGVATIVFNSIYKN